MHLHPRPQQLLPPPLVGAVAWVAAPPTPPVPGSVFDSISAHPMFEPLLVQDRFISILVTEFSTKCPVRILS